MLEQSIGDNLGKHFLKRGGSGVKGDKLAGDLYMQVFRHQLSVIRDLLYRQLRLIWPNIQADKESVAQVGIVDGIAEGFQLKAK